MKPEVNFIKLLASTQEALVQKMIYIFTIVLINLATDSCLINTNDTQKIAYIKAARKMLVEIDPSFLCRYGSVPGGCSC